MKNFFQPNKLSRLHDEWLEGLKVRVESAQSANKTETD